MTLKVKHLEFHQAPVILNFSLELPSFPIPEASKFRRKSGCQVGRNTCILPYAGKMARINHQCFPVECADAEAHYEEFLRRLIIIPGLECVLVAHRYSLKLEVAALHNPETVCLRIAQLLQELFYREHDLDYNMLPIENHLS